MRRLFISLTYKEYVNDQALHARNKMICKNFRNGVFCSPSIGDIDDDDDCSKLLIAFNQFVRL